MDYNTDPIREFDTTDFNQMIEEWDICAHKALVNITATTDKSIFILRY